MQTATKDDAMATMKNAGQNVRNAANDTVRDAKEDLRDAAGRAGRQVRHFIDSASDEFDHAKETVTTQIRSRPMQSGLIALGIGFVLGALFRR